MLAVCPAGFHAWEIENGGALSVDFFARFIGRSPN